MKNLLKVTCCIAILFQLIGCGKGSSGIANKDYQAPACLTQSESYKKLKEKFEDAEAIATPDCSQIFVFDYIDYISISGVTLSSEKNVCSDSSTQNSVTLGVLQSLTLVVPSKDYASTFKDEFSNSAINETADEEMNVRYEISIPKNYYILVNKSKTLYSQNSTLKHDEMITVGDDPHTFLQVDRDEYCNSPQANQNRFKKDLTAQFAEQVQINYVWEKFGFKHTYKVKNENIELSFPNKRGNP